MLVRGDVSVVWDVKPAKGHSLEQNQEGNGECNKDFPVRLTDDIGALLRRDEQNSLRCKRAAAASTRA